MTAIGSLAFLPAFAKTGSGMPEDSETVVGLDIVRPLAVAGQGSHNAILTMQEGCR